MKLETSPEGPCSKFSSLYFLPSFQDTHPFSLASGYLEPRKLEGGGESDAANYVRDELYPSKNEG